VQGVRFYNGTGSCTGAINIAPVGSVSAGNGKWGQADLAGNVWEWNLDWYASPYPQTLCLNCANTTSASQRVFRGGSFSNSASYVLSSGRGNVAVPTNLNLSVGARCARAP
jgi:formylglycine-generating enzyme required for sulfatase activity